MSIEEFVISFLGEALEEPVSGDVPEAGTRFVTVEKTGGSVRDHIRHATIAVQSWAESRAEADKLNEQVKAAMAMAIARPEISRCALTNDYNYPDLETKRPRYQALFDIVYFL